MKKTFTLLFALGLFAAAQAQPGTRDNRQQPDQRNTQRTDERNFDNGRDVVVNHNPYGNNDDRYGNNDRYGNDNRYGNDDRYRHDDRFGNNSFSTERRMRMEIAQINREFDYKTERVQNSFFMSRWEKQRQLRFLEEQRQQQIRFLYMKFKNKNCYDDHDYSNKHHY